MVGIAPIDLSDGRRIVTMITEMQADDEVGYGYRIDVHAGDVAYMLAEDGWWDSKGKATFAAGQDLEIWLKRGLLRTSDARYNASIMPRIRTALGDDAVLIYETPWQAAKDYEMNPDYLSSPVIGLFRSMIVERNGEFFLGFARRDGPTPAKPSWMAFSSFEDAYKASERVLGVLGLIPGELETADHPGLAYAAACGADVRAALDLDDDALTTLDRSFFAREETARLHLVVDEEQEMADDSELIDMPTCFGIK